MNEQTQQEARVCAVVVTFKRQELLRECLAALQNQTRRPDEILVVDNNSGDGTLEMVRAEFPGVTLLPLATNSGGAGGFNSGMAWAHEHLFDWTWVMDDDGRPDANCLERLMQSGERLGAAVYGPICVRPDDRSKLSFPVPLGDEFGASATTVKELENAGDENGVLRGWASFMNGILVSREVVAKAGLPRAEMFIWGDEVEFAKRIKKHGFDLFSVPAAIHVHPQDRIPWQNVLRPQWQVYAGKLDWKAFCLFRNTGFLAKHYGRGKGASVLFRYAVYYLVMKRFDVRSWRFFMQAYSAGWRGDFRRKVPFK